MAGFIRRTRVTPQGFRWLYGEKHGVYDEVTKSFTRVAFFAKVQRRVDDERSRPYFRNTSVMIDTFTNVEELVTFVLTHTPSMEAL